MKQHAGSIRCEYGAQSPLRPKVTWAISAVEQRVTAPNRAVSPPMTPRTAAPKKVASTRSRTESPSPSCPPTTKIGMLIITPISIMSKYHHGRRLKLLTGVREKSSCKDSAIYVSILKSVSSANPLWISVPCVLSF
jgi:hypothetical protein